MPDSHTVRFLCDSPDARNATEVYVAGAFNGWLAAVGGTINPSVEDVDTYHLERNQAHSWEREIELPPGTYDFKFVVSNNQWVHWYEGSDYPRGNDAPGGPNFRIDVGP